MDSWKKFTNTASSSLANLNLGAGAGKLSGSLSNSVQAARERFGAIDEADITALPKEYVDLERRVDALEHVHKNLLKIAKVYETETYDYPGHIQESLQETGGQVWHQFTNFANANLKGTNLPLPAVSTAPTPQPKTLPHALSRAAATSALEVGENDRLGSALTKFALAQDKIGAARLTQDSAIVDNFLAPWSVTLANSIALAKSARAGVRQARLWLDACKQTLKSAGPAKVEQARLEVESAEDKLVSQTETAITLMKNVLDNPEPLKDLNELVKAQLVYFSSAAEALSSIQGEIEEASTAAEGEFRKSRDA